MHRLKGSAALLIVATLLVGCSQTAEKIENAANRSTTSWAMGKPYSRVAALGNQPLDSLSTTQTGYGQLIGTSTYADGTRLYRHIAPAAQAETSSDFGGIVASNKTVTNYRLSYFKVGQDGLVKDWATGSVPGTFSKCISYIGGIFRKCQDQARVQQTLASYDAQVKTSSGTGIDAWGSPVGF